MMVVATEPETTENNNGQVNASIGSRFEIQAEQEAAIVINIV